MQVRKEKGILKVLAFWLVCLLLAFCSSAFGEKLGAEMVKVSTPVYEPSFADFSPPLGTYTFTVSWQGIPAAEVTIKIQQEGMYYHINVDVATYKLIDVFYRLRYHGESLISALDLSPLETVIQQSENSRQKFARITYLSDGEIRAITIKSKHKKDKKSEILTFRPDNFTLEPFSAVFLARSLDWKVGDVKEFDVFTGKSRYLVTLRCVRHTVLNANGEMRPVWVLEPTVRNLTNPKSDKKLKKAKIYISADRKREILQIDSRVFIGTVKTKLKSFKPFEGPVIPGTLALKENKKKVYVK